MSGYGAKKFCHIVASNQPWLEIGENLQERAEPQPLIFAAFIYMDKVGSAPEGDILARRGIP
jgi:hypothetical protein